jgi:hypothetical protein
MTTGCRVMSGGATCDRIGVGYTSVRRADPRIDARIRAAIGNAKRIVSVGAGAGSYGPDERVVAAVEPSSEMIEQRPSHSAQPYGQLRKTCPSRTGSSTLRSPFSRSITEATAEAGLSEIRRVTDGPVVVFTFDKAVHDRGWLLDYLPEMREVDTHHLTPDAIADALRGGRIEVVAVSHDCVDGFAHAYWRRPEAYLDPVVRAGIPASPVYPRRWSPPASAAFAPTSPQVAGPWTTQSSSASTPSTRDSGWC